MITGKESISIILIVRTSRFVISMHCRKKIQSTTPMQHEEVLPIIRNYSRSQAKLKNKNSMPKRNTH